ncbi:hypothetical protein DAY19_04875 [Halobacteriovorax vibrionivorans]|uniref:NADH:quinone oxidoreductase/Mrp antiporter membrane subunit domain-containing protein n=1 Tax=Halobacteriovorax vibrionivorans TaxID=2152716 RepID=A0ABY0IPJ9_9BACT|nr:MULTISPECIES: hypothetical protein [Halobacteriovorax]RZF23107.1 hypothetical protein DAY19_04875 [Halobacteriovorax vibrionivorans]TGD49261.1 hypothetical protein EP118_00205 [Halobacteriovorax sp. Y22]
MIYFNVSLFLLTLLAVHFSSKINNWGRSFISLIPILSIVVVYFSGMEINYLNSIFPFILSFLVIDEKKRNVYEILPFGILLFPIDINIKIIAFASCVYLNLGSYKKQSLNILKLAIIAFITLVDKTLAFKYLFSVYLLLSFLDTDNKDFAITDGVILSYLLTSDIQYVTQNLNQFLIGLSFLIFLSLLNKENIFKIIFVLTAIVSVFLNSESQLMGLIVFYYMIRSFQTCIKISAREIAVFDKYVLVNALSHLGLIGILAMSFSTQNPFFIALSIILTFFVYILGSDELTSFEMSGKWYESFYSLVFFSVFGSLLFLLSSKAFSINDQFYLHAISSYLVIGITFIVICYKFRAMIEPISTQLHLSNKKRLIYMNNIFYNERRFLAQNDQVVKGKSILSHISVPYKTVRTISLIVTAIYFLVLIVQVAG